MSSAIETGIGFREVGVVRLSGEAEDFLVDLHVVTAEVFPSNKMKGDET